MPGALHGALVASASKSDAHRSLILAALANEPTEVKGLECSEDIAATIDCLTALGMRMEGDTVHPARPGRSALLSCWESGTTLRLMLPIVGALGVEGRFVGRARLLERPLGPLVQAMAENGVSFDRDRLPLTASGRLRSGRYVLPGDISSQFVSGILLALPLLDAGGEISLTTGLESAGYVAMTLAAMEAFSVMAIERKNGYLVPGNQRYRSPGVVILEGDWSSAAFFLAAGALGEGVTVRGLSMTTSQPDRAIVDLLQRFGARIREEMDAVHVWGGALHGIEVDVSQTPDLAPVLAVLGMAAEGTTRIENAGRLRLKESDRLAGLCDMVNALGGRAEIAGDALVIRGVRRIFGGTVDCMGDHRLVMAGAIAAGIADGEITLLGTEAVAKSFPDFFERYQRLGGVYDVVDDR